jgi:hypothetical protein
MIAEDGRFMGWINRTEISQAREGVRGRISSVEQFQWAYGGGACRRGSVVFD